MPKWRYCTIFITPPPYSYVHLGCKILTKICVASLLTITIHIYFKNKTFRGNITQWVLDMRQTVYYITGSLKSTRPCSLSGRWFTLASKSFQIRKALVTANFAGFGQSLLVAWNQRTGTRMFDGSFVLFYHHTFWFHFRFLFAGSKLPAGIAQTQQNSRFKVMWQLPEPSFGRIWEREYPWLARPLQLDWGSIHIRG